MLRVGFYGHGISETDEFATEENLGLAAHDSERMLIIGSASDEQIPPEVRASVPANAESLGRCQRR
jgi:hypothetical protein